MLTVKSIKGIVRDGKIEPTEKLDAPEGTEVTINVPLAQPPDSTPKGRMMTFGMFAGPPFTTEEDFKDAEWHGEPDIWGDDGDSRR